MTMMVLCNVSRCDIVDYTVIIICLRALKLRGPKTPGSTLGEHIQVCTLLNTVNLVYHRNQRTNWYHNPANPKRRRYAAKQIVQRRQLRCPPLLDPVAGPPAHAHWSGNAYATFADRVGAILRHAHQGLGALTRRVVLHVDALVTCGRRR